MTDTQTAFVLVPRPPTLEQRKAGYKAMMEAIYRDPCGKTERDQVPAAVYDAMLSAAPKPPKSVLGPVAWRADHQIDGEYTKVFTSSEREADTWRELGLNVQALALHTPQARIDADADIIAALRAEVERWATSYNIAADQAMCEGAGPTQKCRFPGVSRYMQCQYVLFLFRVHSLALAQLNQGEVP